MMNASHIFHLKLFLKVFIKDHSALLMSDFSGLLLYLRFREFHSTKDVFSEPVHFFVHIRGWIQTLINASVIVERLELLVYLSIIIMRILLSSFTNRLDSIIVAWLQFLVGWEDITQIVFVLLCDYCLLKDLKHAFL